MTFLTTRELNTQHETLLSLESLSAYYRVEIKLLKKVLLILKEALSLHLAETASTLQLTQSQADLLYSLRLLVKDSKALEEFLLALKGGGFIYQCPTCGSLYSTDKVLLGKELHHECNLLKLRVRKPLEYDLSSANTLLKPTGRFELIASGSLERYSQIWCMAKN
jgi:hypothetical protein